MKNHSNPPPDPAFAFLFLAVLFSAIAGGWYAENPEVWPHGLICWFGEHIDSLSFLIISPVKRAMVIFFFLVLVSGVPAMIAGDALAKAERRAKARRAAKEAMEADQERAKMEAQIRARQSTPALVEAVRARPDHIPALRLEVLLVSMIGLALGLVFYVAALLY